MANTNQTTAAAAAKPVEKEKSNPKLLFSYSLGEVACQMSWYMINNYLMLFYTDVVGLAAGAISLIMVIARVWDAVNDPMMGSIADRTKSKWGKFRPYLYFAPPFLAIFNILTFTVFPVQGVAKVVLCLICYVGAGMAYTAVSIPYQALQNVVAIDSKIRMGLATARGFGGAVIGIILSACVMPTILHFSGSDTANAHGYFVTTVIMSIAMIPLFWLCAAGCKEKYTDVLHSGANTEKVGFVQGLKSVFKNSELMKIVIATIMGTICVSGRMGLLTYYVIYVVGSYSVIATVFTTMTVAQLIGVFTIPFMTSKLTKKGYMIFLDALMVVSFMLLFINPHCNMPYLLVVSFLSGFCNCSSSICPGLIGDSIEYGDWKLGQRQEGVAASMLSFGVKVSTAISGSAGVLLLTAAGYVANQAQTPAAQNGINIVVNLVPAIVGVASIIPMAMYKLSPKKVDEIRADLDAGKHAWDHEEKA